MRDLYRSFRLPLVLGLFSAAWVVSSMELFAAEPRILVAGLENPESVIVGPGGKIYVSTIGQFGTDGDGSIVAVEGGKAKPFATGLNDPKGLATDGKNLFVADKDRVVKVDEKGKTSVFAAPGEFPKPPMFLNDLARDADGNLYVSDSGDLKGVGGAVYRVSPQAKVSLVIDRSTVPTLQAPNGLWVNDDGSLLVLDFLSGDISRVDLNDENRTVRVAGVYAGGDGLVRDKGGRYYVTEWTTGRVFAVAAHCRMPELLSRDFKAAADCCLDAEEKNLLVPDMTKGTLVSLPLAGNAAVELDESPREDVTIEPAFEDLEIRRPIFLTHAGDGSGRVFVGSELGKILVIDPKKKGEASTFLDITERVDYQDEENEEGLLGIAFHPKFKQNGQFFVYYSLKEPEHSTTISRFRVRKDDPSRADPDSEERLLVTPHPYWNHKGGTLAFGPDGYLYIAVGDGGLRNDPQGNGQNLRTLLGKILRIDVDKKEADRAYAIPKDNPFIGYPKARPEIYAYGLRNVWRMSFDRRDGALWAADVGQDLWEEVNIIQRGGNYGWNMREGRHPFGVGGLIEARDDVSEPIFEYHHDFGKSVTGGPVYRGKAVPALAGSYLFADYVTGLVYALKYDAEKGRATACRPIPGNIQPVMSFGEDEAGEVYFLTTSNSIFRFAPAKGGK